MFSAWRFAMIQLTWLKNMSGVPPSVSDVYFWISGNTTIVKSGTGSGAGRP